MRTRDVSMWPDEVHNFPSLEAFLDSPSIPAGILSIAHNGIPIDVLNRPAKAATTVVMFHTALSPRMKTIPVFSGLGVTSSLDVNIICISDPSLSLSDDLKLAWFAGNSRQNLQKELGGIIEHIIRAQGGGNLIFFGASGGGFASMFYSQQFPGSLAIAVNPQIDIKSYHRASIDFFANQCFEAYGDAEIEETLNSRITSDLCEAYAEGFSNTIALVQNVRDSHHFYRHLGKFLRDTIPSNRMNLLLSDFGEGHVPPSTEFVAELLGRIVSVAPDWAAALTSTGFEVSPSEAYSLMWRESLIREAAQRASLRDEDARRTASGTTS